MQTITLPAYAKINLTLDITGRRADGYHTLDSIMQTVSLCDIVTLTLYDGPLTVFCEGGVPGGEKNTALLAAKAFAAYTGLSQAAHVQITLEKRIPSQAGLGGGSADAAAVLRGLNMLCGNPCTVQQLCQIGVQVGADVPFCIAGGTQRCRGIGEELTVLPTLRNVHCVLCKPPVGVNTGKAYAAYDSMHTPPTRYTETMLPLLSQVTQYAPKCGNVFVQLVMLPEVEEIETVMRKNGALGACMSGSGSAVYGLFADAGAAEKCVAALQSCGQTFLAEFI